jgi:hypothetical protein
MKLAIIVGHDEKAQGANAAFPINQSEYKFNSDLAMDIYLAARNANIDCRIFKRDGKTRAQVGEEVSKFGGVAIELHLNAADGTAKGTETLYDAEPEANKAFATIIQDKICKALRRDGKRNRGLRLIDEKGRGYSNLKSVKITSCLVEPIFCDNKDECQLLWAFRHDYIRALVDGVLEWYIKEKEIN